jgi:hypothetical protein
MALNFVLAFLFQEESSWHRSAVEAETVNVAAEVTLEEVRGGAARDPESAGLKGPPLPFSGPAQDTSAGETYQMKSYLQKMSLWNPTGLTWKQTFCIVWRPMLILVQFPNILWAAVQYAFTNSW